MAHIQSGNEESPPDLDESSSNENIKNTESPPQLADDVVKVVVVGEARCGKTRFIRAYYDHHFPSDMYWWNGVRVYPCNFVVSNLFRKVSIIEIPGDPDFSVELKTPHYRNADIIVFVYAINDPSSYHMVSHKWIPETIDTIVSYKLPVLFLGTKQDLREDKYTLVRLALRNKTPVTREQGRELLDIVSVDGAALECSALDINIVKHIFKTIYTMILVNEY